MRALTLIAISAVVLFLWPRADETTPRGARPVATVVPERVESECLANPPPEEESPPPTDVAATDARFSAKLRRLHAIYLRAYTEKGVQLRSGAVMQSSGGGRCGWMSDYYVTRMTPEGLELGSCDETGAMFTFMLQDDSFIDVPVGSEIRSARAYVGLAVSTEILHDLVLLPNGQRARDWGARFRIQTDAILVTDTTRTDAWRRAPVHVSVQLDGYDWLEFVYRLDRPPAPMRMTPARES